MNEPHKADDQTGQDFGPFTILDLWYAHAWETADKIFKLLAWGGGVAVVGRIVPKDQSGSLDLLYLALVVLWVLACAQWLMSLALGATKYAIDKAPAKPSWKRFVMAGVAGGVSLLTFFALMKAATHLLEVLLEALGR